MSIQYIITCLTYASNGLANRTVHRWEAQAIQQQAMTDYQAWVYRISEDMKNYVMNLNSQINNELNNLY